MTMFPLDLVPLGKANLFLHGDIPIEHCIRINQVKWDEKADILFLFGYP